MLPVADILTQGHLTEHTTASVWAMFCDGGFFPFLQKRGLVIIPDGTPNGDVNHEPVVGAITVVSQEAAQVLESAGEGPLGKTLAAALSAWIYCPLRLPAYSYPILEHKNNTRSIWGLSKFLTGRNLGTESLGILELGKPAFGSLYGLCMETLLV